MTTTLEPESSGLRIHTQVGCIFHWIGAIITPIEKQFCDGKTGSSSGFALAMTMISAIRHNHQNQTNQQDLSDCHVFL